MKNIVLVMLGGGLGAGMRYGLSIAIQGFSPLLFPWPTFIVNIAGSIAIGLLWGVYQDTPWFAEWGRLLLIVGVCGGFTTFSAFSFEVYTYLLDGRIVLSLLYVVLSVILCVLGVWLGQRLATSYPVG